MGGSPQPQRIRAAPAAPRIITTRVIVFLLLGAMFNVAVAWAIATYTKYSPIPRSDSGRVPVTQDEGDHVFEWWEVDIWRGITWEVIESLHARVKPENTSAAMSVAYFNLEKKPTDVLPGWATPLLTPSDLFATHAISKERRVVIAIGWPNLATSCETEYLDQDKDGRTHWGLVLSEIRRGRPNVLPLRPLWPGFAINTLFYAVILWLLFAAPFALRRRSRIKRGLCPKCAYPVGESPVCTECGAPV